MNPNQVGIDNLTINHEEYWIDQLASCTNPISLPWISIREKNNIYQHSYTFSLADSDELMKLSKNNQFGAFALFVSWLKVLLYKYTDRSEFILNLNYEGNHFFNIKSINNDNYFREILLNTYSNLTEGLEHSNFNLEEIRKKQIARYGKDNSNLNSIAFFCGVNTNELVNNDLLNIACFLSYKENSFSLDIRYKSSNILKSIANQFFVKYIDLIKSTRENIDIKVQNLQLTSETEKQQLLYGFNNTKADYPKNKTIIDLIKEQAEKNPESIALIFREKKISYIQIYNKANLLAKNLRDNRVGRNDIVAIMVDRSIEMIIGILGIIKAGGAYMPIDPNYPLDRKLYMIKNSNSNILLTQPQYMESISGSFTKINIEDESIYSKQIEEQEIVNSPTDLVYVIYTSGSTGKPKGVMIEHRSLVNYINWAKNTYLQGDKLSFPLYTAFSFDLTVTSIFLPLISGNTIVIYPDSENNISIHDVLLDNQVDIVKVTPAHLKILKETYLLKNTNNKSRIKRFIVGGEELTTQLAKEIHELFAGNIEIYNEYGPTEATVGCMIHKYNAEMDEMHSVPIGIPIDNTCIYILDKNLNVVPVGVSGELYISGACLAREYVNNFELTNQKFIEFNTYNGDRFYKTGDLARWLPNGVIEFLGRIDNQVKIRGYRIELGEIETILLGHTKIKEAAVIVKNEGEEKYLCAYIVKQEGFSINELRIDLSKSLPDYMLPSYFVELKELPLTTNGKIDRNALSLMEVYLGDDYIAPTNAIEEKLAELWSKVLSVKKEILSVNKSFFELGGHSLKATILISKIHKEFNIKVPLFELFNTPTISGLSKFIKEASKINYLDIELVTKKEYYPLSSAQKRLYFLQQLDLKSKSYNMPRVMSWDNDVDIERLELIFKELINRHESLRTEFITINDEPIQRIKDKVDFKVDLFETNNQEEVKSLIEGYIKAFDLTKAPLLRSCIIKTSDNKHVWVVDTHHIISDGTSGTILIEDFISLYNNQKLKPLKFQYKDFSEWQNNLIESGGIKLQDDYWLNSLSGEIPRIQLPTDFKRPEVFTFEGEHYSFSFDAEDSRKFREFGEKNSSTLYMNFLTALNVLFYKYTGQTDITIGSQVAGRPHSDLLEIVGMFVNTLVMRNNPKGEKTYKEFLKEVVSCSVKAFENQDVQFEDLVDKLGLERDTTRTPVFDISMVVQNFRRVENQTDQKAKNESVTPNNSNLDLGYKNVTSKFDMTFFIYELKNGLSVDIEYYTGIFKRETIARLAVHLKKLIAEVIKNPEIKLAQIEILTEKEKHQLLYDFNNSKSDYPKDKTIHHLFEEQVLKTPDKIAIIGSSLNTNNYSLTYNELNSRSNQLANYLIHVIRIKPNDKIGILMANTPNLIVSVIGILKSGAAYVPLDPSQPEDRLKGLINSADISIVISSKNFVKLLNRLQWESEIFKEYLCLDSINVLSEPEREENELMDVKLWDYVGETSNDDITGGGWNTSYTGEPFSKREMDEYGDNILHKLNPLLHKNMRVLEIGCSSGLSMYKIAPKVSLYYGTDLSGVIIKKNKEQIEKKGIKNIKLSCAPAHEIDKIDENDFDLIIINSVIQSFHGHNYLRGVINKCIDLLKNKGFLFIGDVMDQDLKNDLIQDMIDYKRSNSNKAINTKTDWSSELFISRSFFNDLQVENAAIQNIDFSKKICTIQNELTKYRYDTIFTIEKENSSAKKFTKYKYQSDLRTIEKHSAANPVITSSPDDLAYVIYTSGTTGKPKGVMIKHQSLNNYVSWGIKKYICDDNISFPLYTNFSFDLTATSIYIPLLSGNKIVTYEDSSPQLLIESIIKEDLVDIIKVTPSHLKVLQNSIFDLKTNNRLKKFIVGGEALESQLCYDIKSRFKRNIDILNEYGPTEATVGCMIYTYNKRDDVRLGVPIGIPVDNVKIYLLDGNLNLLPSGSIGEIYISGDSLSHGYLNNTELTDNFFVKNPFEEGERLYKTGDLARWLPDGNMEFLGRIDQQVKIRGHRIELGEIESVLLKHDSIKECIVQSREANGDKYLCAYIVCKESISQDEIRNYMTVQLPHYMIPSFFVEIDKIPLTVNGKINHKALPLPGIKAGDDYAAPSNEIEEKLVEIWAGVLNIHKEEISVTKDFFSIGGHSLKATVLSGRIYKELGVVFPLRDVFLHPTVRTQAAQISTIDWLTDTQNKMENPEKKEICI